mmetsp:Transcript_16423/g.35706  ORF Transcript_16423/g.35706 Transcript_16423/m.35706 type:complete len:152 (-) Transcript_16423:107-562(-)|eukprot:CAMPEP_0118923650 /NCGR_PEP_ID=MMETSP1169-20130426/2099_1 /TAXON_ID=36882 /ORGANISM="Pyramimonas obovata, Strain CCMP722" /LENGTH=151 /DNA_ID=CAMNT_0006864667 /DNA_START=129 /DNA_END=584 /DNA_ORIENTATION=+
MAAIEAAADAAKKLAMELFHKLPKRAQRAGGLPGVMYPQLDAKQGRWHGPVLPARFAAGLRKEVLLSGREWPWEPERGVMRGYANPPKGHKRDKERDARWEIIKKKMADMPKTIEAFRQSKLDKPKSEQEGTLEKLLLTSAQIRKKRRKAV